MSCVRGLLLFALLLVGCAAAPGPPLNPAPHAPGASVPRALVLFLDPTWDSFHRDEVHAAARAFERVGVPVRYVAAPIPDAVQVLHGDSADCHVWAGRTILERNVVEVDPVCGSGTPSKFRHLVLHELAHAYLREPGHVCRDAGELPDPVHPHEHCLSGGAGRSVLNAYLWYAEDVDDDCADTQHACDPGAEPALFSEDFTELDLALFARRGAPITPR